MVDDLHNLGVRELVGKRRHCCLVGSAVDRLAAKAVEDGANLFGRVGSIHHRIADERREGACDALPSGAVANGAGVGELLGASGCIESRRRLGSDRRRGALRGGQSRRSRDDPRHSRLLRQLWLLQRQEIGK